MSDVDYPPSPKLLWVSSLLLGLLIIAFDVLRKTVFRTASWNYHYPSWNFVYNVGAFILLALLLAVPLLYLDGLMRVNQRKFLIVIYLLTLGIAGLSYFSLPIEAYNMSLRPESTKISHDFLFHPATILLREGPLSYFSDFHSLPTLSGADRRETSRALSQILLGLEYVPFNEDLANSVSKIVTQRHGPIPPILVAPFMFIFGVKPESAVFGAYVLVSATPVIAYYVFQFSFEEPAGRIGALLIAYTPALHIWLRHKTIPYDALTGLLVVLSLFFLYQSASRQSIPYAAVGGLVFSMAALSKITVLPILLPIGVLLFIHHENTIESYGSFVFGALLIPILLIPLGYNFIVQYLFDIGRIVISTSGQVATSDPAGYLQKPLLGHLSAWYNLRLLGIHSLIFTLLSAWYIFENRYDWNRKIVIGIAAMFSVVPFAALSGLTLARHLIPYLAPMGLFYLIGVEKVDFIRQQHLLKPMLVVNALLLLVNV